MSAPPGSPPLDQLPVAPASSVKGRLARHDARPSAEGRLLITNHNQPEAVILSTAEYARLLEAAQAANQAMPDPLAELRRRFDERLAALDDEQAGDRLRDLMRSPGRLDGKVKAGSTY